MSQLDIKQAFLSHLLDNLPTGLTSSDVTFENKLVDHSGKDLWLAAFYIPATSQPLGKTSKDFNDDRGFYQVSVFVPLNSENYDNVQLQAISEIESAFSYNTELVYNDTKVFITGSDTNAGVETDAWFQRDLTINFLTFTQRG